MEVWTWAQLGIHRKPVGLLNAAGFYDDFLRFLDRAVAEGFVRETHCSMLIVADAPAALLDTLVAYEPPDVPRWLDADEV